MERVAIGGKVRLIVWLAVLVPLVIVIAAGAYCSVALPGCASCHAKGAFGTQTAASSHAKVACASCHVGSAPLDRAAYGYRELFTMLLPFRDAASPEAAQVPDARCLTCHAKVAKATVTRNGIRVAHKTCAAESACSDCHGATAHGTATRWAKTYDMETCLACHVSKASTACDLCHTGRTRSERVSTGIFATTHGPNWKQTHGMGNVATCTACHTAANCTKCHGPGLPHDPDFVTTHAQTSKDPQAKCASCHQTAFCDDCHGLKMPHPSTFTRTHSKAATADKALCQRCHAPSDCTTCHEKHVHPGGAVGNVPAAPATGTVTP